MYVDDLGQEITSIIYETAIDYTKWPSLLFTVADFLNEQEIEMLPDSFLYHVNDIKANDDVSLDFPLLRQLSMQLERCVTICEQQNYIDSLYGIQQVLLDTIQSPAFLITNDNRVMFKNNSAKGMLGDSEIVQFVKDNGKIDIAERVDIYSQRSALIRDCSINQEQINTTLKVGFTHYNVSVYSISPNWQSSCFRLIIVNDLANEQPIDLNAFAQSRKITPAEARLLSALVKGSSLREYAKASQLSLNTVRSQLKSIFIKTGCHRQSDLIKMVYDTCKNKVNHSPSSLVCGKTKHSRCYHQTLTLSDGRTLGFSDVGKSTDLPVILFHRTFGSRIQDYGIEHQLLRFNIRLICPERPGFGLSSPHPDLAFEKHAQDVMELCDVLGLDRVSLIGLGGGTPYTLAASRALGHRVASTQLIGPISPFGKINQLNSTTKLIRYVASYAPLLLKPMVTLMIKGLMSNPGLYFDRAFPNIGKHDLNVVNNTVARSGFIISCHETIRQGYTAIVQELRLISRDWRYLVDGTHDHLTIWRGAHDTEESTDKVRALHRELNGSALREIENGGYLLLISHFETIMSELIEHHSNVIPATQTSE